MRQVASFMWVGTRIQCLEEQESRQESPLLWSLLPGSALKTSSTTPAYTPPATRSKQLLNGIVTQTTMNRCSLCSHLLLATPHPKLTATTAVETRYRNLDRHGLSGGKRPRIGASLVYTLLPYSGSSRSTLTSTSSTLSWNPSRRARHVATFVHRAWQTGSLQGAEIVSARGGMTSRHFSQGSTIASAVAAPTEYTRPYQPWDHLSPITPPTLRGPMLGVRPHLILTKAPPTHAKEGGANGLREVMVMAVHRPVRMQIRPRGTAQGTDPNRQQD